MLGQVHQSAISQLLSFYKQWGSSMASFNIIAAPKNKYKLHAILNIKVFSKQTMK
jgi:hypothetical protein